MTDEELAVEEGQDAAEGPPESELTEDQKLMAELKEAIEVRREEIGALRLKLTVTVPRDTLDQRLGKQFAELKRESVVPGFRKGHAPLRLVEKRFGADVGEQLKSQLLSSGYLAAVEKENLKPLGDPLFWVRSKEERTSEDQKTRTVEVEKLLAFDKALDHLVLPKDGPLSFSCELELKPEFELPALDKVPVEKPAITIDDEDVDVEINRLRMRRGTFEPVEEGSVEPDDMLYVNMKMIAGGDVIASEDNFDIAARDIRVKGVPLLGLGDALVGKEAGDTATFEATVPDDHENIDLRGKKASFEFTIREIKRLALPPIDAEFLSTLGYDSEQDLRSSMKSLLDSELDRTVKNRMFEQIGEYLVKNTSFELPEGLSQRQTDRVVTRRMIELLQAGVPPAQIERTRDELRAKAHDQSVRDLKLYFILEKIAESREIEVKEDEINGAIAQIARRTGKRFDRVRDELAKGDGLSTLYWQLRDEKVFAELLKDAAITHVEGPKKKTPSPKPAAKAEPRVSARATPAPAAKHAKPKPKPEKKPVAKAESRGVKKPAGKSSAKGAATRKPQKRGK